MGIESFAFSSERPGPAEAFLMPDESGQYIGAASSNESMVAKESQDKNILLRDGSLTLKTGLSNYMIVQWFESALADQVEAAEKNTGEITVVFIPIIFRRRERKQPAICITSIR